MTHTEILNRIDAKLDKQGELLQDMAVRLGKLEQARSEDQRRVELFWNKDWKGLTDDVHDLQVRVRHVENRMPVISYKASLWTGLLGLLAGIGSAVYSFLKAKF